jgi:hypothetical protein
MTPRNKRGSRKAHVVLSAEQYELIKGYAREQGKAVSSILRESLERTLLAALEKRRREAALRRLTNQDLPITDWESIERELEGCWVSAPITTSTSSPRSSAMPRTTLCEG